MTGRGRTCDAPLFKRALYRLSYGHVDRGIGLSVQPLGRGSTHRRPFWTRFGSRIGSLASSPTMLSMHLAYPSTLDHPRLVTTAVRVSYVEGFWSPMPTVCKRGIARVSDTWSQVHDSDAAW